jgi:hypothetical protein
MELDGLDELDGIQFHPIHPIGIQSIDTHPMASRRPERERPLTDLRRRGAVTSGGVDRS